MLVTYLCRVTAACALSLPFCLASASAQTVTNKDLSADAAITIATAALAKCKADGYKVSTVVIGRFGEIIVQVRGDGAGPHTMDFAFKKAYTARTSRVASGEMEERLKNNPQIGTQYLPGFTTSRGALPIKIGDDVAGAAGVSGAPGGEKDEACVQTGLDKAADQLK